MRMSNESLVMSIKYLVAFLLLFLMGCCSTRYLSEKQEASIETKTNTITVPVPPIVDTLEAKEDSDQVYAEKIIERDTVLQVRYLPTEKKIYVKVKPDSIVVTKLDTVTVYKVNKVYKEPGFFEKEFWYIAGFLFLLIVLFAIIKIKK